jgi:hypothetical protein
MARSRESALKHSQSLSRGVDLDHCPVGNGFDNIFIEARGHRDASTTDRTGLASSRLEDTHPPGSDDDHRDDDDIPGAPMLASYPGEIAEDFVRCRRTPSTALTRRRALPRPGETHDELQLIR